MIILAHSIELLRLLITQAASAEVVVSVAVVLVVQVVLAAAEVTLVEVLVDIDKRNELKFTRI